MRAACLTVALLLAATACERTPPPEVYFEREILPILQKRCTSGAGGPCHVNDGQGRAMGNLDLSTYEGATRRPGLLRRYGSYPYPQFLMKASAGAPEEARFDVGEVEDVRLDIRHAGGAPLSLEDDAFWTLQQWLENGATRSGMPPLETPVYETGECVAEIRDDFFPYGAIDAVDTSTQGYAVFRDEVWPIFKGSPGEEGGTLGPGCLGRECHGARDTNWLPTNQLYFTCGDDDRQMRFNYLMARTFIGSNGRGQLSEKPLRGGGYHAGGKPWDSVENEQYQRVRNWQQLDSPYALPTPEGELFFRYNVHPLLVARGCFAEACHGPAASNAYQPMPGTDGIFGPRALLHNYLATRYMLGLQSRDATQGRLLEKNITTRQGGIPHKGGALLAPRPDEECEVDLDEVEADPTRRWFEELGAACVVSTWHALERRIAVAQDELSPFPGILGVFVRRPPNPDRHIDFDTYRPGADLLRLDFVHDVDGRIVGLSETPTSLLTNCGVNIADADVRRPDIMEGGSRVVWAMRTSADEGLDLWVVDIDGTNCHRLDIPDGDTHGGMLIHHFDPTWLPNGDIAFASTRGVEDHPASEHRLPSRTPRFFLPNSNIFLWTTDGELRSLSHLTGAELMPRATHTGEVIFAVEKAAPGFYQFSTNAVRAIDGGGYRPHLGQRPNIGYDQAVEAREMSDLRTVFIASDVGTYFGGGTLGVFDYSLGTEEPTFQDLGFMHSVNFLDPDAAARPGEPGTGTYRSPTPLPDGRILVAYSPEVVDLGNPSASVDYGLWIVDPEGLEEPWEIYDTPGDFDIEPVVARKRIWIPQPVRHQQGDEKKSEVVYHSIPLLAPMLNQNTRLGTEPNELVTAVHILEQEPVPAHITSADEAGADVYGPPGEEVYVKWRRITDEPIDLLEDGSLRVLVPSMTPILLELYDADGNLIDWQREAEQFGPGETEARMIPVELFDAGCGSCHNAGDGTELSVIVGPDVITGASTRSEASRAEPIDLYVEPAARPEAPFDVTP